MNATFRRPAAVLIMVLWALVLLSLLAAGLSFALKQDLAVSIIERDRVTAHWLARAGVERAVAEVMIDEIDVDTTTDTWCDDEEIFHDIPLTGGTYSVVHDDGEDTPGPIYGASDESAKLNVNVATREQLMNLPDMTAAIAGAILDWRSSGENPEPDGALGGYYSSLAHPYKIRNGQYRTTRELLLVRDVTPDLLYGEDANGNGLLDPNENDGRLSQPEDNGDGQLRRGWFAYLTVYSYEKNVSAAGQKRLNLNRAGAGEISQRLSLEDWAAESIVKAREKKAFEHLVDLLKVQRDPEVKKSDGKGSYARSSSEEDTPVTRSIFKQIYDSITLKDEDTLPGRINVNTAAREVLKTLPGVEDALVETIIEHRDSGDGFRGPADLLDVPGVSTDLFGKIEDSITVRSNVFRIMSTGQSASKLARASIECIVDRGGGSPKVLYWLESSP
ncbi:MAG TPA: helix-hairpin-helix domain-containing protein [Chloroflexota bacterium]|nr:helix-hairpin-helix domain-containing protein [Chloroflexota bacterium]